VRFNSTFDRKVFHSVDLLWERGRMSCIKRG